MPYSTALIIATEWQEKANKQIKFTYYHDPQMKTYLLCSRMQECLFYLNRQLDHSLETKHAIMFSQLLPANLSLTRIHLSIHCLSEDNRAKLRPVLLVGRGRSGDKHLTCITQTINWFSLCLSPAGNTTLVSVLVNIFVFSLKTCKNVDIKASHT